MENLTFSSRRSVVVSKHGSVASSNPMASQVGLDILKAGGNAADAAVAVAAALNVTEPMNTGLGGDAFCMFYDCNTKSVQGLNGSGRSSTLVSLDYVNAQGFNKERPIPPIHGLSVTVPGAAAAWIDTVETWGSGELSMKEILSPAIEMAETGFPVQEIASYLWATGCSTLKVPSNVYGKDLLLNGKAPRHGDIMKNPPLATTFKELATNGKKGFYEGRIAKAIVDLVNEHGGVMGMEDLSGHRSTMVDPIYTDYRGRRVWELPPNGQGMTALIALNILEGFDLQDLGHNTALYLHYLIESLRLAFADSLKYCTDPEKEDIPLTRLLSKDYAKKLQNRIENERTIPASQLRASIKDTFSGSDTVYFTTADQHGNACSFINSNFMGFGTALVPEACGFTMQNRGCGFSLDSLHANVLAPGKRPYHTIIPSMVTDAVTGELLMSYGVMGGYMQPQGHVQVFLNMLEFGYNPQEALDKPRVCLGNGYSGMSTLDTVLIEEGISANTTTTLKLLGHNDLRFVSGPARSIFGRGQVISQGVWWSKTSTQNLPCLYWSGSDPRSDGLVAAY